MSKAKRDTLLYLAVGGLLIMILAMSLSNLVLAPASGLPFPQAQAASAAPSAALPGGDLLILVTQGVLALTMIMLPVIIVYSMLTPGGRRRLIACAVLLAIVFFLANYLQEHRPNGDDNGLQQAGLNASARVFGQSGDGNGALRFPAKPPSWIAAAIILAVSILVSASVLWAVRFARQRNKTPESALDQLAEQAQNAIDALGAGSDLRQTVIRCYQEMNRVVREETGIARESAMTPREFEARLVSQGLPREGVSTLTRLFEQVRYGSISADSREEAIAVSCLTDIVNACKNVVIPRET